MPVYPSITQTRNAHIPPQQYPAYIHSSVYKMAWRGYPSVDNHH